MNTELLDLIEPISMEASPQLLEEKDLELQRLLAVGDVVSVPTNSQVFTKIGAGSCGAVFAQGGGLFVLKLSKTTEFSLWNDYVMHMHIRDKMKAHHVDIKVPDCYFYIRAEDAEGYLASHHPSLVEAAKEVCNLPTRVLATQRINPLPDSTRIQLINRYCAPRVKANALADPANRDCLVRIYLGSMAGKTGGMFFSLRNFKLHLNQIIELRLNVSRFCVQMARSLAIMHWAALTDARDVEFVLGSSTEDSPRSRPLTSAEIRSLNTEVTTGPASGVDVDYFHRPAELWLLDFNLVQDIELNDTALGKLVSAHNANDPYYPKPCQEHPVAKRLWNDFATAYMETAALVLCDESSEARQLPGRFLKALVVQERAKQQQLNRD